MVTGRRIIPQNHDNVGAGARLTVAPVEGASHGPIGDIIEHQVGMPSPVQPALNAVLVLRNRFADDALRGSPVRIGGSARDRGLALEPVAEFIVGATHVLAQDVPAGGFILV